jgi:hypothetical protein
MKTATRLLLVLLFLTAPPASFAALLYEDPAISIGQLSITVCRADFNGDARPDVATANVASRDVSILLGDGTGDFLSENRVPGGAGPFWISCGDVTGDGRADLVFSNLDWNRDGLPEDIQVVPGDGIGGFGEAIHLSGHFYAVLIADTDRDGLGDLVASDDSANTLHVFRSLGGGSFAPGIETPVPSGAGSLGVADLNGDGHVDAVSTLIGRSDGRVAVLIGDGTGGFSAGPVLDTEADPEWVEFGDFDEDGRLDMAIMESGNWTVSVHRGRGDGTFDPPASFPAAPNSYVVLVGDYDGDGHLDLLTTSSFEHSGLPSRLEVLVGTGTGDFLPGFTGSVGVAYSAVNGDFNRDGRADLVIAQIDGRLRLLEGRGDGTFGPPRLPLPPPASPGDAPVVPGVVTTGDVNGDGRVDIVLPVRGVYPGRVGGVAVYLATTMGAWTLGPFLEVESNPLYAALADLDGDGDLDLITSNEGYPYGGPLSQKIFPADIRTFLGVGDGSFTPSSTFAFRLGGPPLTLRDEDGDGVLDLFSGGLLGLDLFTPGALYRGLGTGAFTPSWQVDPLPVPGRTVGFVDLDHDGKGDLITERWFDPAGLIAVLRGLGGGQFAAPTMSGAIERLGTAELGDADSDGFMDLLFSDIAHPGSVRLLRGQPDGRLADERVIRPSSGAHVARLADVDGDGDTDIVLDQTASGTLEILQNDGGLTFHDRTGVARAGESFGPEFADLNGDGLADLLYTGRTGVAIHINRLRPNNRPPTALAAAATTAECTSPDGAQVLLDGRGSSDPDSTPGTRDDIVAFDWFEEIGGALSPLGSGETLQVTLTLGSHALRLRVTDRAGGEGANVFEVDVVDTTPPQVSIAHGTLWPPNHRMIPIAATVSDHCSDGEAHVTHAASSEPDDAPGGSDGTTTGDVLIAADGSLWLRAERDALGTGRAYTVGFEARDGAGNRAAATAELFVPHDMGGLVDPLHLNVSQSSAGTLVSWTWRGLKEMGPVLFDVVRGDLGLVRQTPQEVSLGALSCLEAGSVDTSTASHEDAQQPAPGLAVFYLVQYRDLLISTGSSYGEEQVGRPRVSAGGCR